MSLSSILFLFLTHLGVGLTLVLAWVGKDAGVKFFRFNAGTAALLIAAGFALRPNAQTEYATLHRISMTALIVAEAALVIYWATIGRMLARVRPGLAHAVKLGHVAAFRVERPDGEGTLSMLGHRKGCS